MPGPIIDLGNQHQRGLLHAFLQTGVGDRELADLIGVEISNVRHWRRGDREMPREAMALLFEAAGRRAEPLFHYLADLAGVRVRIERGGACGDVAKEGTEAVAAAGRVTHELLARLADGQIDDADAEAMLPLADDLMAQATEFRAALRQRVAGSRR